jgi:hypothetical protein
MFLLFSSLPVESSKQPEYTPIGSLIARMYWLVIGHITVLLLGIAIYTNQLHYQLIFNILYVIAAVLCPVARFVDIKYYKGTTTEGEPSTMAHWRRYSIFVAAYAAPLWIAVQVISRLTHS